MQHPLVTLKVVCVLAGLRISQIILTGRRDLVPPHRPTLAHLRATEVQVCVGRIIFKAFLYNEQETIITKIESKRFFAEIITLHFILALHLNSTFCSYFMTKKHTNLVFKEITGRTSTEDRFLRSLFLSVTELE